MSQHSGHAPLAVFTGLASAGAGLVAAQGMEIVVGGRLTVPALAAGAVLQAVALVVSLSHLGRPWRAPLAATRLGRSPLSNEVVLAGLSLVASAGACSMAYAGQDATALTIGAAACCASFLLSVGAVYAVPGQASWARVSALLPLSAGLAFGAIAVRVIGGAAATADSIMLALWFDLAVVLLRWRSLRRLPAAGGPGAGRELLARSGWFAARVLLLDLLPALLLIASPTRLVILLAAAGLGVDRWSFYALGQQHTTEREVGLVEAAIEEATQHQM